MEYRPLVLQRLHYFMTVASELHFGRAAAILHIAQPALSQQIRQLEAELDITLFERSTRKVALTAQGLAFLPHAKHLLVTAQATSRAAQELSTGQRGDLRVGFVDSAAYEFVPQFLHRFRLKYPAVNLILHTMSSDEQATALRAGKIDLGIARVSLAQAPLRVTVVGDEPLVVALPSDHSLAENQSIWLKDLFEMEFVGFAQQASPTLHAKLRTMLMQHGVSYSPTIEATEYTTILGLVAAGEGLALVPRSVKSLQLKRLTFVELSDQEATVQLLALCRLNEPAELVTNAYETLTHGESI